jgi:ribosomal protein S18 acetylase RimI-like enzyme
MEKEICLIYGEQYPLVYGEQSVLSKIMGDLIIKEMVVEQVESLVEIHMKAFSGYSNTKIGKSYVKSFLNWFINDPSAITITAVYDGDITGYVVGAPVGYQTKMNKDLMGVVIIGIISHPWVIFNKKILSIAFSRLKVLFNKKSDVTDKSPSTNGNVISLVGIAVSPEYAGLKIGSSLMKKFEEIAHNKKFNSMRLSVYNDNEAALKLYHKSGWNEFSRSDKTITFTKTLNG